MIEKLGTNVHTGNDQASDDLVTLMRFAVPQDQNAADAWYASVSSNVMVYKVDVPRSMGVARYPLNQYSFRTGTAESQFTSCVN